MLWYVDGLEEALANDNHDKLLINFFEENKEEICFGGCQSVVVTEDFNDGQYYSIEMNGDDDMEMSFIIQDENQENLALFNVNENFTDVKEAFNGALNTLQTYVEEDIKEK